MAQATESKERFPIDGEMAFAARFFAKAGRHLWLGASPLRIALPPPARQIVSFSPRMAHDNDNDTGSTLVCGAWRGLDLPFAAESFASLVAFHPFLGAWEKKEINDLLAALWRIIQPQGRLALICQCGGFLSPAFHQGEMILSPRLIRACFARAGFELQAAKKISLSYPWGRSRWRFEGQKQILRPILSGAKAKLAFQPA